MGVSGPGTGPSGGGGFGRSGPGPGMGGFPGPGGKGAGVATTVPRIAWLSPSGLRVVMPANAIAPRPPEDGLRRNPKPFTPPAPPPPAPAAAGW